ncbi:MAG: taurine dioxygenase [Caulobacteraceae bacterium]|nr:taurine dioxygenase [Caulobacteraceae bacterium]
MNKPASGLQAARLAPNPLTLAPLTPTIGAEVSVVDLSEPLEPDIVAAIRAALLDWKVLFFRGQDIDTDQHIAFWDNRASQHYAVSDYWPAVRRMERATIIGDRPR